MTDKAAKGGSPEPLMFINTVEYYDKSYGRSSDGNDQKAVANFKNFESREKLRRLQTELQWVKEGKVSEVVCDRAIGKKRKAKYESYEHWASLMLLWLAAKR